MNKCPFPLCRGRRGNKFFCCFGHWVRMSKTLQGEANVLLDKLFSNEISPGKYSEMRDDIVSRCPGAFLYASEFDG
jgi:hypothetical protein